MIGDKMRKMQQDEHKLRKMRKLRKPGIITKFADKKPTKRLWDFSCILELEG